MSGAYEPRALFGGPLLGGGPMRFIYVDEAGKSAIEPHTFVVGIMVDVDKQWRQIFQAMRELVSTVPEKFRKDFRFHATEIWNDHKYRDGWSLEERLNLLLSLASLPSKLGLPIAAGMVNRRLVFSEKDEALRSEDLHHIIAFGLCATVADLALREHCSPLELGVIVAEDVPKMRILLKNVFLTLRQRPIPLGQKVKVQGAMQDIVLMVDKIIDTVHFVQKQEAIVTQIADVCAFGLRRAFAKQDHGDRFYKVITGADFDPSFSDDDIWSFLSAAPP